jgi:hypothetical protein
MQLPAEVASKLFIDSPSKDLQIVETDKSVQIIRLIGKKEAFTKTFDDVKQDLAKESLMKKKTEQAIKTKAAEVLQAWKTELTTPVLELEEEQEAPEEEVVSILSQYQKVLSEPFSPVAPELPGAGNAPELLEALSEVTETGILETAYATTGGYLVVRVVSYQEPKEEELKRFTQQVKMSLAQTFKANTWTAFEVQSRNEASVEEIWKARKN